MKIESRVCDILHRDNIIQDEEKDIILYGLHQGKVLFITICTLVIICTVMGCVLQGILFLMYFWPLRIYAGGYHADTEKRCYFLSTLSEICIFMTASFCDFGKRKEIILIEIILVMIIFLMSPQDTENRRLSSNEKVIYKRKVNKILIFHSISFFVTYLVDKREAWEIILLSQILMVFILIIGYMKENLKAREKRDAVTKTY